MMHVFQFYYHDNLIYRLLDIVLQQLVLQAKMDVCTDRQEPVVSIDMNRVLSRYFV